MQVLLTGARAPATLELARLCARSGHTVHVADTMSWHICRGSRLVAGVHRLPAPRQGHGAYAAAINRVIARQRIDVVLPTCEEVFHLAALRDTVQAPVLCEPRARLAALHDKARFIAESERAGLRVPRTHSLLHGTRDLLDLPVGRYILKPRYSRFATRVLDWESGRPLPALDTHHGGGWIAQERLDGRALCTWSVAHRGVVLAHSTYAVDETAGPRGAAISFHSLRHAATLAWVRQFVACHALSGQFAFDFIETAQGLRAIECNPRLTSGVHCFRHQPDVADRLLDPAGSASLPLLEPPAGLQFRSRLALLTYRKAAAPGAGLLDAADDPWPRRLQLASWLHLLLRAAVSGSDPRLVSTRDIEWNGE